MSKFTFNSDSDDEKIPDNQLEKYKECVEKCAEILDDKSLLENPLKIVDAVRKKLTEQMTKKARIQSSKNEIQNIYSNLETMTLSDLQRLIAQKKDELIKLKETNREIEESRNIIKEQIEKTQQQIEQSIQLKNIISKTASLNEKYQNLVKEKEKLEKEESNLKIELSKKDSSTISHLVAEEQMKRMNIQSAIDSLRAEEEKRISARHLYLNEKKKNLTKELESMRQEKSDILRDMGRVQHLEDEIKQLNSLLSREEKKTEIKVETQETQQKQLNKDRIGRLIMLLFSEGFNSIVVENLAEELSWSKQQTVDFMAIAQGRSSSGIGSSWIDWLGRLIGD